MLHLAHVIRNKTSSRLELHLLAVEESKLQWTFCHNKYLFVEQEKDFPEGVFFLVELDKDDNIVHYQLAKDWILNLIKEYLVEGNSNANINVPEEQARLEKWRQELTAKSQELTRIRLEIETRREELQQLEQNLSWEREKLKLSKEEPTNK